MPRNRKADNNKVTGYEKGKVYLWFVVCVVCVCVCERVGEGGREERATEVEGEAE